MKIVLLSLIMILLFSNAPTSTESTPLLIGRQLWPWKVSDISDHLPVAVLLVAALPLVVGE